MYYPFNIDKAIQASAVLLQDQERQQMERIRLLKLLYLAEREAIEETGRPIIGSKIVALKKGPLHSKVYDLIKGEDIDSARWNRFFRSAGVEVELVCDPGVGELSRFELRKLKDVYNRYRNMETWDLVELTHLPEWKKNYPNPDESTSRPIPFRDIVEAVGRANELDGIMDDLREAREMERLFG